MSPRCGKESKSRLWHTSEAKFLQAQCQSGSLRSTPLSLTCLSCSPIRANDVETILSAPSVCRRVQESLLSVPQLYAAGQRNTKFNARVLALWLLSAVWHSLVCFYLPVLALSPKAAVDSHGQTVDIWATGTLAYTIAIVVVRPDDADITNRLSKLHMYAGGVLTLTSRHPPVLAM